MPEEWHGQVPARYAGQRRAPFCAFDTFMVVNKTTGIAVQGENCPGRAAAAADVMSSHNEHNGHADRYGVVRIPRYLSGKDSPANWQRLLDQHN